MLISVIIPAHNEEKFLGRAIRSVLETRFDALDILVIDDASTDETALVARAWSTNCPKILRYIRMPVRRGVTFCRNEGIAAARGDLICFLDADDFMLPSRFSNSVRSLADNPDIDGCVDAVEVEFETVEDKSIWGENRLVFGVEGEVTPGDFLSATLIGKRCHVLTPSLLVRKNLFERSGRYRDDMRISEDYHLWLRMAACGRFLAGKLDQPVARYMRHSGNTWSPEPIDAKRVLWVHGDIMRWANHNPDVSSEKRAVLRQAYENSFIHCLDLSRERMSIPLGFHAVARGMIDAPSLVFSRRTFFNLARLVTRH